MQSIPGLMGARQAMQRGALLGGKDAAALSWRGAAVRGQDGVPTPTKGAPMEPQGCWGEAHHSCIPGRQPECHGQPGVRVQPKPTREAPCVRAGRAGSKGGGHSLSAWLPKPPKALLPRLPRPPKVPGLLKGSVGTSGVQVSEWLTPGLPSDSPPTHDTRTWQVPRIWSEGSPLPTTHPLPDPLRSAEGLSQTSVT